MIIKRENLKEIRKGDIVKIIKSGWNNRNLTENKIAKVIAIDIGSCCVLLEFYEYIQGHGGKYFLHSEKPLGKDGYCWVFNISISDGDVLDGDVLDIIKQKAKQLEFTF